MAQTQVVEADAVVSLQGSPEKGQIIRSRIPSSILDALGAQDGDALHYKVVNGALTEFYVVQGGAEAARANRVPPTPPVRAKKATAAPAKPKRQAPADDFDDLFGGNDEPAPAPVRRQRQAPVPVPVARPAAPAPRRQAPAPIASGARRQTAPIAAASPRQPRVQGPIPKPNQGRKKGGGVGYQIPE